MTRYFLRRQSLMRDKIYECCKDLRLSATFADNSTTLSGDTHQEYLLKVLQAEQEYRNNKRKELHLKQVGFDQIKTFENYDFEKITIPSILNTENLRTAAFIGNKENLVLYGRNGTGKSHMATAIGV